MNALEDLVRFKKEFEPVLAGFIKAKKEQAASLDEKYAAFIDILEDFTMRGGKRIRPAFMYFSYLACGGGEKEKIRRAAVAVELLQSFLLIHDDLIDRSDLRRGRPTVQRMFEKEFGKLGLTGEREHFGWSTAIICGDLAHTFAYEALLSADFGGELLNKARKLFDEVVFETVYGWYREMLNTMSAQVDEKEVIRTIGYVSAKYTIIGPAKMGAILAGAGEEQLAVLAKYGTKLGTAFQIQDDILGMFGGVEEVGKPVNSDMVEGKKTLLFVRLLAKLAGKERERFLSVYGKSEKMEDLVWVRDLMKETLVLKEVREEAGKLANEAIGVLTEGGFGGEGAGFLKEIAAYLVERKV